jgi:hypothetical protein
MMERRGYDLSGQPLIKIGFLEKIYLVLQNKLFRLSFGIRRYGIILYTCEKLSKLLSFDKINKKCVLMKHQIDRQHLK